MFLMSCDLSLFLPLDVLDDDHHWSGPELRGQQQLEPAAAAGPVWDP